MKKTKIGVELHKNGSENDVLLRLVGNVNESGAKISQEAICNYLLVRNAMYPILFSFHFEANGDTLHISEDAGKTFTLTLTWKEVETLQDIPKETFTGGGVAVGEDGIII